MESGLKLIITLEKIQKSKLTDISQILRGAGFDLSRPFTREEDISNGDIIFKQVVPGS